MDSRVMRVQRKTIEEMVESPFYRFKEFVSACNELNLKLKNGFGVVFRAYNDGVAYRFYTTRKDEVIIENEVAEFNFPEDYIAYLPYSTNDEKPMAMAYQNIYDVTPLSKAKDKLAFLPVTVDLRPLPYPNGLLSMARTGICHRNRRFHRKHNRRT